MVSAKKSSAKKAASTPSIVWVVTLLASLYLAYLLLRPYLAISALAILMAFVFFPMYEAFKRWLKSNGGAIAATTVAFMMIVAIPVAIVVAITVSQALQLASDISSANVTTGEVNFVDSFEDLTEESNERIESWFGIKDALSTEDVQSFVQSTIPTIINAGRDILLGIVTGIPNFFTLLIVFLFVFTSVLANGRELHKLVLRLSPFDAQTNKRYLERMGAMAKAMLKGQMLIALAQGLATAGALALVGFADYFLVFAVIFTFLSFIPLGAGIVSIPIGIALLAIGNIAGGILVLLNHFVVVTNIDNIVRPMVVPDDARMPAVLTILSAFGGVALFGLIGVIYGPMIMIFVITTIDSYLQYKEKALSPATK